MFYTRYLYKLKNGRTYEFPFKWLVKWVELNAENETLISFSKKASEEEWKRIIKVAQKEGVGKYITEN